MRGGAREGGLCFSCFYFLFCEAPKVRTGGNCGVCERRFLLGMWASLKLVEWGGGGTVLFLFFPAPKFICQKGFSVGFYECVFFTQGVFFFSRLLLGKRLGFFILRV